MTGPDWVKVLALLAIFTVGGLLEDPPAPDRTTHTINTNAGENHR
jgi:hypothetical protein